MIEYKNCVAVLLFNQEDKLALQLRAAGDASFPSHWDFSAGGSIDPGEEPDIAAARELREELGVAIPLIFVDDAHYSYPAWTKGNNREVDDAIYVGRYDGAFSVDPKEVDHAEFRSLLEIAETMQRGEKFHPEFVEAYDQGILQRAMDVLNAWEESRD